MILPDDLFDFCYFFDWSKSLDELTKAAMPEPWSFVQPDRFHNLTETPILDRYIRNVYRYQAITYNSTSSTAVRNACFTFSGAFACMHTGLYTPFFQSIYALFELNRRRDTRYNWVFKGFYSADAQRLRSIPTLPLPPQLQPIQCFHSDWEIRVNYGHILQDQSNRERIPESVRDQNNLPLLLQSAVLYARSLSMIDPTIIVPQLYCRQTQFLMPICLTDVRKCDLAMTLTPCEGYYYGSTCLTLEMAYINARMLARPSASWLSDLVANRTRQYEFDYSSVFGLTP